MKGQSIIFFYVIYSISSAGGILQNIEESIDLVIGNSVLKELEQEDLLSLKT